MVDELVAFDIAKQRVHDGLERRIREPLHKATCCQVGHSKAHTAHTWKHRCTTPKACQRTPLSAQVRHLLGAKAAEDVRQQVEDGVDVLHSRLCSL